jgi:hypothetical protein
MLRKFWIFLFLCFACSAAGSARSQQLHWDKLTVPATISNYWISPTDVLLIACANSYYRSYDHGLSWEIVSSGFLGVPRFDSSGRLWGLSDSLRYSNDVGSTWSAGKSYPKSFQGFEVATSSLLVNTFAMPNYVEYTESLYQSRDAGATWQVIAGNIDTEFQGIGSLFTGPRDRLIWSPFTGRFDVWNGDSAIETKVHDNARYPSGTTRPIERVFFTGDGYVFGIQDEYLLRSSDGGANWYPLDSATLGKSVLPLYHALVNYDARTLLEIRPDSTEVSTDHATNWSPIGTGVPSRSGVINAHIDSKQRLFALSDSGFYRSTYFSSVTKPVAETNTFTLYPNPAKSILTISYSAKSVSEVVFQIVDDLGATMQTLKSKLLVGEHKIQMDVHALSAGTYFLSTLGSNSQPQKFTVLK